MTAFLRLVARLPLPVLHAAGAVLAWLIYALSPRFRRFHVENMRQAGVGNGRLRRAAVAETGKAALELPAVWLRPQESSAALVRNVEGWERVTAAMASGRGLIFLTPHLGCWEVSAQYFSLHYPLTVLYAPPKMRALEPVMRAGRMRGRLCSVPANLAGVRALRRALRRGEAIGMLPDQVPGRGEGEWCEFFGRQAYTMTLAMRLAQSSGSPVLIARADRLPRGRGFALRIDDMPPALPGESPLRRMNRALEEVIRRNPAQYLWAYNRYKVPAGVAPPGGAG